MLWSQELESHDNHFQLEQWVVSLHFLLYSLENGDFLSWSKFSAIIIKYRSDYLSELHNEYELLHEYFTDFEQNLLKKLVVVVKFKSEREFRLEVHPNRVCFLTATLFFAQQNLLSEIRIKVRGLPPVLA